MASSGQFNYQSLITSSKFETLTAPITRSSFPKLSHIIIIAFLLQQSLLTSCSIFTIAFVANANGNDLESYNSQVPDTKVKNGIKFDAFKAIRSLHNKLDVDADGEVDDLESKKFLESSQKNRGGTNEQKLSYLHQDGKDRSISVDELWNAWTSSEVYNWTISDTVYWLVNYVELPEYSIVFEQNEINGTVLPRLATDLHYLSKLGISEPSAKSKISIKAMDVVLFGPPKVASHSKLTAIISSIILVIALSGCFISYSRSRAAQQALQGMKVKLESIQNAEDQISELQKELEKSLKVQQAVVTEKRNLEHQLEIHRQFSASSLHDNTGKTNNNKTGRSTAETKDDMKDKVDESNQQLVSELESKLKECRKELQETTDSMYAKKFRAPARLRNLLRATYEMESQFYNEKKLNLEAKAADVKLRNQKLQKKKTSFFGYYKIAQENSLEDDLNSIVEVKNAFQRVTKQIKERNERWREIEDLCGCSLDLLLVTTTKTPYFE